MSPSLRSRVHAIRDWPASVSTLGYLLLIAIAIALLLPLSKDFGWSWDIGSCELRGRSAYAFYFDGFDGNKYVDGLPRNGRYYGPVFELFIEIIQNHSATDPVSRFEVRTLLQAILTLSCLIAVFLISIRVVSRPLALIAVVLVASTPLFFGHAFINPKDGIFMSTFIWCLYLILHCFGREERPSYLCLTGLAVLLGLSVSLRYIAVYLLLLMPIAAIVLPALRPPDKRAERSSFGMRLWHRTFLRYRELVFVLLIFAAAYLAAMPGLLADLRGGTLMNLVATLARYPWHGGDVLYFGKAVPAVNLPWHYTFGYLFVQLPLYYHLFLFTLVAFVVALPRRAIDEARRFYRNDVQGATTVIVLLLALVIPFALLLIVRPVLYDASRHLLFVVPLLCMLLFFAFAGVVRQITTPLQVAACMLAALSWMQPVLAMKRLHPYEYAYYNPLVTPAGSFELDYWGTSFREIADKLNRSSLAKSGTKLRLRICGPRSALMTFLDADRFERARRNDPADLVVALNHRRCVKIFEEKRPWLLTVNRGGSVFAVVGRN